MAQTSKRSLALRIDSDLEGCHSRPIQQILRDMICCNSSVVFVSVCFLALLQFTFKLDCQLSKFLIPKKKKLDQDEDTNNSVNLFDPIRQEQ